MRRSGAVSIVARMSIAAETIGPNPPASRQCTHVASRDGGRGAAWTEERAMKERATREGGASRAPAGERGDTERAGGRGAAWTEERATKERATREGGASRAPAGERGDTACEAV